MEGIICQWKDDKGFGFIKPNDGSEQLFFHVSSVKNVDIRPKAGESVAYDLHQDEKQRLTAINIMIVESQAINERVSTIKAESPYKGLIDYLLIFIILALLGLIGYQYFQTQDINYFWYLSVPAIITIFLIKRPKRPKENYFHCTGCRETAEYDPRTLAAWQAGFAQLYCSQCHSQWLRNRPKSAIQPGSNSSISKTNRDSGCLGMLLILVFISLITSAGLYHWQA